MATDLGYTKDLLVLPFDHRGSFLEKLFGIKGRQPNAEETKVVASYKDIVYDGFKKSLAMGVPKEKSAVLVDEQFGERCLLDAKASGITTCMPTEKSGQDEFDFEYGREYGAHVEKFDPSLTKVLVRFNVEGDAGMNARQAARLKELSEWLKGKNRKFMFELLVPATDAQLKACGGDKAKYDVERRPALMAAAIRALQKAGVEPDVWKLEGVERAEDAKMVADAAREGGRGKVGIIVLGRGESAEKVKEWLKVGAKVPGVIGFAVGRTVFWDALTGFKEKRHSRDAAVEMVAKNYKGFVDLWTEHRK
jgi:5-dehydro-2-deoxygluconokinase